MFSKRVLAAITACFVFTPAIWGSAGAEQNGPAPCYVDLLSSEDVRVNRSRCSSIELALSWGAASPGLVNEMLEGIEFSFSVEDSRGRVVIDMDQEETAMLWAPIYEVDAGEWWITCPHRETIWASVWRMDVSSLEGGVYDIHTAFSQRHAVYDGLQQCSYVDGTPLGHPKYEPFDFVDGFELTIH